MKQYQKWRHKLCLEGKILFGMNLSKKRLPFHFKTVYIAINKEEALENPAELEEK